jgi:hypothetical protein
MVFVHPEVWVDEPDVEPRTVPGAPGLGIGKISGAHDAGSLGLGPISLHAEQSVIVAVGGIADDIARLEDAGGSGV